MNSHTKTRWAVAILVCITIICLAIFSHDLWTATRILIAAMVGLSIDTWLFYQEESEKED